MKPVLPRATLIPLLLCAASCGGAAASNLAHAVTDTLPGGIPRVTSSAPTAWTDSAGARLVEEIRFGGEDGTPSELSEPRSIAVDGAGRIYVSDTKPAIIKVFNPDGTFLRSIGREGDGPGEFRNGFIAVRGGFLVLHDPQAARTSVWDTAGTFLRSWHDACCYWMEIQIDKQNRIYVASPSQDRGDLDRGTAYVRWTPEGAVVDTVWVPRIEQKKFWSITLKRGGNVVSAMNTAVPFVPDQVYGLHPEGGVVVAWSGAYSIVRSQTGPDSALVFGRAWTPDPVSDERRQAQVESQVKWAKEQFGEATARAAFRLGDIPSTLPAFRALRVDDAGRVWVTRFAAADTTHTFYDVFDSTGAYLGPVSALVRINPYGRQAWTADALIAAIEDDEGKPAIVRLRLQVGGPK